MKKSESRKRVGVTDNAIADAIFSVIENLPDLTYGEILCALSQVTKRYSEYLMQTESEEENAN